MFTQIDIQNSSKYMLDLSKPKYITASETEQLLAKNHCRFPAWVKAGVLQTAFDRHGHHLYVLSDVLRLKEILSCPTTVETAHQLGVSRMTLNNWFHNERPDQLRPRYVLCGVRYYCQSDIDNYRNHCLKPIHTIVYQ